MKRISPFEAVIMIAVPLAVAGMSVPKISSNIQMSHQLECVTNMNTIELAVSAWEMDHGKNWPEGWISKTLQQSGEYDLSEYISDEQTLNCPTADDAAHEYYYQRKAHDTFTRGVNCYYCNSASYPHKISR